LTELFITLAFKLANISFYIDFDDVGVFCPRKGIKGKLLNGDHKYLLHFNKEDLPPVEAFWSITMYDAEGYQTANSINRFAVSSWMPFKYNADGSLDLTIQHDNPGAEKVANWLPAPSKGALGVTMRLYAPKAVALDGRWNPPAVKRLE